MWEHRYIPVTAGLILLGWENTRRPTCCTNTLAHTHICSAYLRQWLRQNRFCRAGTVSPSACTLICWELRVSSSDVAVALNLHTTLGGGGEGQGHMFHHGWAIPISGLIFFSANSFRPQPIPAVFFCQIVDYTPAKFVRDVLQKDSFKVGITLLTAASSWIDEAVTVSIR